MRAEGPIGEWSEEELRRTHRESSGAGADHDLRDPSIRFLRGVARLVRAREAFDREGVDPKRLSVFLLDPAGGEKAGLKRVPMLDNGRTCIAGNLWFVGPPVVSGWPQQLEVEGEDDDDAVFRAVTEELGWGGIPAVVVDPRLPQTSARYYPNGLSDVDCCEIVSVHSGDVDLQQVYDVIDRQHKRLLITPDAHARLGPIKLWSNERKHWPQKDAENRIQAVLKAALLERFATCDVQHETSGISGRVDLRIDEINPHDRSQPTHLVLLELKVLRSYGSTGRSYSDEKNAESVDDGVKQAAAYRTEYGHRDAALCCFDMRTNDGGVTCFEPVKELAETLHVALHRWFLYSSSEQYREAQARRAVFDADAATTT